MANFQDDDLEELNGLSDDELLEREYGRCDTCNTPYHLGSRVPRCGDCGDCDEHCDDPVLFDGDAGVFRRVATGEVVD